MVHPRTLSGSRTKLECPSTPAEGVKAPKLRITSHSPQGFAYQTGEQQLPPVNKVIAKIIQHHSYPPLTCGTKEPHGKVLECCLPTLPSLWHSSTPSFGDPESKAIAGSNPVAPQKEPGEGETPQGANKGARSSLLVPPSRCAASSQLPLLTYGGSCQIKKKIQAAQSFPFCQLHP